MIEVRGLTKRYGEKVAVKDLAFGVGPGQGDRLPGTVSVDGQRYSGLANPMREVGALLDAKAVHGGRSACNYLLCLAQTNNLPRKPVDEMLDLVGLSEVAGKGSKGFSLARLSGGGSPLPIPGG